MRKFLTRSELAVCSVLALGHIGFYFYDVSQHAEGGWGGFLVFVVDLPISILLVRLSNAMSLGSPIALLIGGTVWWFGLGILIVMLFRGLSRFLTRFFHSA